jgi:hypothetical protein
MAVAGHPASGVHLCPWGTKTKDLGPQSGQWVKSLGDPKCRMAYFHVFSIPKLAKWATLSSLESYSLGFDPVRKALRFPARLKAGSVQATNK